MADSGLFSSPSGAYRSRGSIASYIESSVSAVFTDAATASLNLGVMSDHQVYADAEGRLRGVFIVTAMPSPPGATVALNITLPWGEVLELHGTVEWVRDHARLSVRHRPGMGVKLDVDPRHLSLLERALVLREPIAVPPDARFS